MSIIVYWAKPDAVHGHLVPHGEFFEEKDFNAAMKFVETLRKAGYSHVSFSSEPEGLVGKPGVDTVADGKTPDGFTYEWSKAHRAGASKRRS